MLWGHLPAALKPDNGPRNIPSRRRLPPGLHRPLLGPPLPHPGLSSLVSASVVAVLTAWARVSFLPALGVSFLAGIPPKKRKEPPR